MIMTKFKCNLQFHVELIFDTWYLILDTRQEKKKDIWYLHGAPSHKFPLRYTNLNILTFFNFPCTQSNKVQHHSRKQNLIKGNKILQIFQLITFNPSLLLRNMYNPQLWTYVVIYAVAWILNSSAHERYWEFSKSEMMGMKFRMLFTARAGCKLEDMAAKVWWAFAWRRRRGEEGGRSRSW